MILPGRSKTFSDDKSDNMKSEKPIISVIIPVYNVDEYLERCVDSVLDQTYQNLEIVLVDDGSTDKSGDICDWYGAKDKRISVIHKKNGGQSEARNKALDVINGEYVTFVDADDFICRNMIALLYDAITESGYDFSVAQMENGDSNQFEKPIYDGESINKVELSIDDFFGLFDDRYRNELIPACGKLYRASLFGKLRFPAGMVYEDDYLIHHILALCKKGIYLEARLYYHFIRENSTTKEAYSEASIDAIKAMEDRCSFFEGYGNSLFLFWCYKDYLRRIQFHYYSQRKYFPNHLEIINVIKSRYRSRYKMIEKNLSVGERFRYGLFLWLPKTNMYIKNLFGARRI